MKNINLNVMSNKNILSSIQIVNKCMNSFYKLTNVLFLLLLVFGSCGVSFGMIENNLESEYGNDDENKNNDRNNTPEITTSKINNEKYFSSSNLMLMQPKCYSLNIGVDNQYRDISLDNMRLSLLKESRYGISFGSGYGLMQYPNVLYGQDANYLKRDTTYRQEDFQIYIDDTKSRIQPFVFSLLFNTDGTRNYNCYKVSVRNSKREKEMVRDMGILFLNKSNMNVLLKMFLSSIDTQVSLVCANICSSLCGTESRINVTKLPILARDSGTVVEKKVKLVGDLKDLADAKSKYTQEVIDRDREGYTNELYLELGGKFKGSILKLAQIGNSYSSQEVVADMKLIAGINTELEGVNKKDDEFGSGIATYLAKSKTFKSAIDAIGAFGKMAGLEYCIKKVEDSLEMIRLYRPYLKEIENRKSKPVNKDDDLAATMQYPQAVLRGKLFQKWSSEVARREKTELKDQKLLEWKNKILEKNESMVLQKGNINQEDELNKSINEEQRRDDDKEIQFAKKNIEENNISVDTNKGKSMVTEINKKSEVKEIGKTNNNDIISEGNVMSLKDKDILIEQESNKDEEIETNFFEQHAMMQVKDTMEGFMSKDTQLSKTYNIVSDSEKILTKEEEYVALLKSYESDKFHNTVSKFINVYKNQFVGYLDCLFSIMNDMGLQEGGGIVYREEVDPLAQLLYDNGIISGELYRNLVCYASYKRNEFLDVFENPDISDYQKRNYGYKWFIYSSLGFVLNSVLSGIGGEDNSWMVLSSGNMLSWNIYMSNIFTSFGINAQITLPMPLPLIGGNLNIHVVGVNFLSLILGGVIFALLPLQKIDDEVNGMINTCIDSLCPKNLGSPLPNNVSAPGLFREYNGESYIKKIKYLLRSCFQGRKYSEEREYLGNNSFLFVLARRCLFDTLQLMSISIPVNTYMSINVNFGTLLISWLMFGGKNKNNESKSYLTSGTSELKSLKDDADKGIDDNVSQGDGCSTDEDSKNGCYDMGALGELKEVYCGKILREDQTSEKIDI